MQVIGGRILTGNTATAQISKAEITDGTNVVQWLRDQPSTTTANAAVVFPSAVAGAATGGPVPSYAKFIVSGTMQLVITVSTAAVSVTQTFAVVCRCRTAVLPTATLNDTIGTSTNTTNTNQMF